MKKMILVQMFMFIFILPTIAQNQLNESNIKSALSKIFDLSKKQEYQKLAAQLINEDNLKKYDYQQSSDARSIKRISKKIKAYLDLSDSYQYVSLTFDKFNDLPSAELEVSFKSGDQDLNISFIFVEYSGQILLVKFK